MRFRPCIDIHNGQVKQIVGGSLRDQDQEAETNFASAVGADYYARLYRQDGLSGGHVILLNAVDSEYYPETRAQAIAALKAYQGGLQVGGGITADNCREFLDAGASHVIVTSYVFQNGVIEWGRLKKLCQVVGKEHLVLDLSCRKRDRDYFIVTNRWQYFTETKLNEEILTRLAGFCDEFLIHGVDVEGKRSGMEAELVEMLGRFKGIPVTYAGGIGSMEDLSRFRVISGGNVDFTIGSALDLFGGSIRYDLIKTNVSVK